MGGVHVAFVLGRRGDRRQQPRGWPPRFTAELAPLPQPGPTSAHNSDAHAFCEASLARAGSAGTMMGSVQTSCASQHGDIRPCGALSRRPPGGRGPAAVCAVRRLTQRSIDQSVPVHPSSAIMRSVSLILSHSCGSPSGRRPRHNVPLPAQGASRQTSQSTWISKSNCRAMNRRGRGQLPIFLWAARTLHAVVVFCSLPWFSCSILLNQSCMFLLSRARSL
jgi:hypothetical protein